MTSRLIILSNRIPTEAVPEGGLVVALHDCLSQQGGIWIGAAAQTSETESEELTQIGSGSYDRYTFDLTEAEHAGFYLGYANSVLWPLFHRRSDLIDLQPGYAQSYGAVNARVAGLVAEILRPGDLLWVHDYHFLPVAQMLRQRGIENRIGFFLHTPFPMAADLRALPDQDGFLDWMAAFDIVGLQSQRDVSSLLELARSDPRTELMRDGSIRTRSGQFRALSFPIGIDVEEFEDMAAANEGVDALALGAGERLLIGVDRLDYSKGLPNRFHAFAAYLEDRAEDDPRVTFLQIAPPSRSALGAYRDIQAELESTTGALNGRHGDIDWTPLRYISRNVPREKLARLYRRADVGLVTPLADGMNLVAKEYVAAQDPEDPGVLILSHFAGAAEQLTDALLVNPYDTSEMARTIATALSMPHAERVARHARMMDVLRDRDIHWWTSSFLANLSDQGNARLAG